MGGDLPNIRGAGGAGKYGVDKMPGWLADLHGSTYAPWARDMSERSDILFPLVIDVVVFDVALDLARISLHLPTRLALSVGRSLTKTVNPLPERRRCRPPPPPGSGRRAAPRPPAPGRVAEAPVVA